MDERHKADLLQRLKSAHGHLGGVIRMAAIRGDDTSAGDRVRQEILDVFHAGSRSARGR